MSENTSFAIAFVLGIIVFIYFYSRFLKGKSRGQRRIDKAIKDGTVVKGTVVKRSYIYAREPGTDNDYVKVTYEYVVDGKTYKKKIEYNGYDCQNYPDYLEIYYNKRNPKKSLTYPELSKYNTGNCLLSAVIPIIVIKLVWEFLKSL